MGYFIPGKGYLLPTTYYVTRYFKNGGFFVSYAKNTRLRLNGRSYTVLGYYYPGKSALFTYVVKARGGKLKRLTTI